MSSDCFFLIIIIYTNKAEMTLGNLIMRSETRIIKNTCKRTKSTTDEVICCMGDVNSTHLQAQGHHLQHRIHKSMCSLNAVLTKEC